MGLVGFLFLPFLWFVNLIWFFKYAFMKHFASPEQKGLKKFVVLSGIGLLVWVIILAAWNTYFQLNRATASWGDDLSFIIPVGRA